MHKFESVLYKDNLADFIDQNVQVDGYRNLAIIIAEDSALDMSLILLLVQGSEGPLTADIKGNQFTIEARTTMFDGTVKYRVTCSPLTLPPLKVYELVTKQVYVCRKSLICEHKGFFSRFRTTHDTCMDTLVFVKPQDIK